MLYRQLLPLVLTHLTLEELDANKEESRKVDHTASWWQRGSRVGSRHELHESWAGNLPVDTWVPLMRLQAEFLRLHVAVLLIVPYAALLVCIIVPLDWRRFQGKNDTSFIWGL